MSEKEQYAYAPIIDDHAILWAMRETPFQAKEAFISSTSFIQDGGNPNDIDIKRIALRVCEDE